MEPLFPALPEDLSGVSDDDLAGLISEHEGVVEKIKLGAAKDATDEQREFLGERQAAAVMDEMSAGVESLLTLRAEQTSREEAAANFTSGIEELAAKVTPPASEETDETTETETTETEGAEITEPIEPTAEAVAEVVAEAESVTAEAPAAAEAPVEAVAASGETAEPPKPKPVRLPAPPRASRDRQPIVINEREPAVLVASAGIRGFNEGQPLDKMALARAIMAKRGTFGTAPAGFSEKVVIASASFPFPPERTLTDDAISNGEKILAQIPEGMTSEALVASGGLCAPLTPVYAIPGFSVQDRPVRDALPSFRADRGGVNVPTPSDVSDSSGAITVIEEPDDALGGTFATKSCLAQTCPAFTEVPVTVISHCRTFGNLNSRAWPEFVAHENDETMAAHARSAETYLLDRIVALSIAVTTAAVYNSAHDLIYGIARATAGIRNRLRMRADSRFRALLPSYVPQLLAADIAATQFDRFVGVAAIEAILERYGIAVSWYLDSPGTGTTQNWADEAAGALDNFPTVVQYGIFPEGEFIHVDGGSLELGIVRDSTLNETNDYQVFGETFENVARVGPTQGALWISATTCPSAEFPALTTALSCS